MMKKRLKRIVMFTVIGALVGLGGSYLYSQIGSSCQIMCNPVIASAFGGLFGLTMSVTD